MLELVIKLSYFILAPLSFVASILLLWSYFKVPKLKEHPGVLIFWQCLSQCIVDCHWFTSIPEIKESLSDTACNILGGFACYFYFVSWNYTIALSYEIYLKIQRPHLNSYKFRTAVYHLLCFGFPVPILILLTVFDGNNGDSVMSACFIQNNTDYELVMWIAVAIHSPLCFAIVIYSLYRVWGQSQTKHLIYHTMVVLSFTACWLPFSICHGLSSNRISQTPEWVISLAIILACPAGLVVFCAKLSEPNMFKNVLRSLVCKKRKNSFKVRITEIEDPSIDITMGESFLSRRKSSYGNAYLNLFSSLTSTNIVNILFGLNFLFNFRKRAKEGNFNFKEHYLWEFGINLETPVKFSIKEYSGEWFEELRRIEGIQNVDLAGSFEIEKNSKDLEKRSKNPGGRGNAFFYFTADKKYILKTIKSEELKLLKSLLPSYLKRVCYEKSLISRILGVFTIRINKSCPFHVVLMENILSECQTPLTFDLKGSTVDRQSCNKMFDSMIGMPRTMVYKDIDFRLNVRGLDINSLEETLEILAGDTLILQEQGIMDYSLLVGVEFYASAVPQSNSNKYRFLSSGNYKIACYIGLIDYLQAYNSKKRLEHTFKRFKKGHNSEEISSVPPVPYRDRFLNFVAEALRADFN